MEEISKWLEGLGLAEYAGAFADNRIDFSVLPDLTEQDLKDLGVVLGDRRKLLRAIGELDGPATPARGPSAAAERRQLTVMFCDLVGSTALSTRLDPEDLRRIVRAYTECCAEVIERNGGFVAQYMGDGVLAYFGYPHAHEHDAERAVRAGLALAEAVPRLETAAGSLPVRVGIATGVVVVGDLIGTGQAQQRGVVGETPNLAARLQGLAEPNHVVIAEGTRALLGNLFELQDLGAKDLKGIAAPARAWAVVRESPVESRFEAMHATVLGALVGRDEESQLLLRRWSMAKAGEGQCVLVSGEAGIGKSRLTAGFLESVATEPHARLRYFCSPQHTDSALYPVIARMQRAAGLARDDAAQTKLDKLDASLALTPAPGEEAALFADLLSLPNDGRYPAPAMTPQQRRQATLDALLRQIETLGRDGPVLMVVEDAHWIDPTTLEFLGRVVDRNPGLRILLVVTFRPEFNPPWTGRAHVTRLAIDRLAQRDVGALIDRVAGDHPLPAGIRRDILARTDGIPLFVEEMTKAILEAKGDALSVPASLQASLMARLDRLGPAKEFAQVGAAIGREFSHALLASVARKPEAELASALDRLVLAGLLFRQGSPPHATYLFNHALVQDAAYGSLLRETRQGVHARIAAVLEGEFADVADSQPELLARHLTEGGVAAKAALWWGKAGRRSLARSALVEAAEQLTRALGQIAALPGTPALRREQIELQVALANALMHTRGHAAPGTKAALEEARSLIERAEGLGEPPEDPFVLFSVLYGFWVASRMAFKGDVARDLAAQFHSLASSRKATGPLMIGHLLMGISLVLTQDIAAGRAHLDRVIALYDPAEHRSLATRFGHDVRMSALCWRGIALWLLGKPESALADAADALADARATGHAASLMYALAHVSLTLTYCGKPAAAGALADELIALANEKGASYWKAYAMLLQGWHLALSGKASEAVQTITAGIGAMRSTGATAYAPWYLSCLAEAYAELGEFGNARRVIGEAAEAADTTGEKWCAAEICRIAEKIALRSTEP